LSVINLPNTLTVARIVIIPIFVTAVIYQRFFYALVLFVVAALTDLLDGFLARATNQKTALGTFLDPLADKFLLVSSFVLFAVHGWIPLWLTITVISRDVIVVIGWLLIYMITHNAKVETVLLGKAAIALQLITLAVVLLGINLPGFRPPLTVLFAATAALTAVSGLQYIYKGLKLADAF
jgi:cardiolipin synthase (CMP-forming)